jgi:hypothetical protein
MATQNKKQKEIKDLKLSLAQNEEGLIASRKKRVEERGSLVKSPQFTAIILPR